MVFQIEDLLPAMWGQRIPQATRLAESDLDEKAEAETAACATANTINTGVYTDMDLDQLIKQLCEIREQFGGSCKCACRNTDGEWDIVAGADWEKSARTGEVGVCIESTNQFATG